MISCQVNEYALLGGARVASVFGESYINLQEV